MKGRLSVAIVQISRLLRVGSNLHFDDLIRVGNAAIGPRGTLFDHIDIFHALSHFAPDGVLAIKMRCIGKDDEELGLMGLEDSSETESSEEGGDD